ncbi:flavonol synthase/flavanone 3-hydroxylase [Amborella trichopoda]|uniref:flavonol synthase/flavanone 3-hydroxylase n=1 Tax=Amborella trichopoda TaxID=13333 RepID=UPI0009C141BE|nr:flavonol synthase/flavanone 3-hydroxylase [Amborella trichopoda]|eukprot:XP_020517639.1 flavonol synthase/flavanone 3-hydroxylase [Amborella trichopoda]
MAVGSSEKDKKKELPRYVARISLLRPKIHPWICGEGFFSLPQEYKEQYANYFAGGVFEGYGTKLAKNPDQKLKWIDYFFHFMWPTSRVNYDKWPKSPPNYREVTEEYGEEMKRVAEGVLEALSVGLGLEAGALKEALGGEVMSLETKINLYPPCPCCARGRPD